MNVLKKILISLPLLAPCFYMQAQAESTQNNFTVVELFTSQGCSSCPGADRYLGVLAKDDSNITLACHVTYWNYLGWRDTFSSSFCDKRQRAYRDSLNKSSSYTPQMVINGKYEGIGSQRRQIQSILTKAKTDKPLSSIVLRKNDNQFELALSDLETSNNVEILLLGVAAKHSLSIGRGENTGRTLDYHNPIVAHYSVATLPAKKATLISQKVIDSEQVKTWVALAQDTVTGRLLAAGRYEPVSL